MDTLVFGPPAWAVLFDVAHVADVAAAFDSSIRQSAAQVAIYLQPLLPCKFCRESYDSFLGNRTQVKTLYNKDPIEWTFHMKNLVNRKLNIEHKPTLRQVRHRLQEWQGACSIHSYWDLLFMCALNYNPRLHPGSAWKQLLGALVKVLLHKEAGDQRKALATVLKPLVTNMKIDSSQSVVDAMYNAFKHWQEQEINKLDVAIMRRHVGVDTAKTHSQAKKMWIAHFQHSCGDWRWL